MDILEKARTYIADLDEKHVYRYTAIIFLGIFVLSGGLIFYHRQKIAYWRVQIKKLNKMRSNDVRSVLSKIEYVEKQLRDIDSVLNEDKTFRITEYFKKTIDMLGLQYSTMSAPRSEKQGKYTKVILDSDFDGLDMKQLTELLKEFEENQRIFVEKLNVEGSEKVPNKLKVSINIGTFLSSE